MTIDKLDYLSTVEQYNDSPYHIGSFSLKNIKINLLLKEQQSIESFYY
jgi:hypothetical protein